MPADEVLCTLDILLPKVYTPNAQKQATPASHLHVGSAIHMQTHAETLMKQAQEVVDEHIVIHLGCLGKNKISTFLGRYIRDRYSTWVYAWYDCIWLICVSRFPFSSVHCLHALLFTNGVQTYAHVHTNIRIYCDIQTWNTCIYTHRKRLTRLCAQGHFVAQVHMHTCVHTYTYTYTQSKGLAPLQAHGHITDVHIYIFIHAHIHICIPIAGSVMHACIHIFIHAYS
jgi:hypothetical protein